jgi:hypothetical protein
VNFNIWTKLHRDGGVRVLKVEWRILSSGILCSTVQWSRACYLLHAGFLFGLFFDSEDGGIMFFWNTDWLSPDYMVLYLINIELFIMTIMRTSNPTVYQNVFLVGQQSTFKGMDNFIMILVKSFHNACIYGLFNDNAIMLTL